MDTLEATFAGELKAGLVPVLDKAKERAQLLDRLQRHMVGDTELFAAPKGLGKYRFVLSDADMQLRISTAATGIPPISVRLFAAALAEYGHVALYAKAATLAAELGADVENTLSRIDLCLDVQGWEFTEADLARIVCPASFRSHIEDGPGVSFQIGKGDVVLRIYRKDAELKAKKKTAYAKVWERVDDYDPALPVWRIEVQLRGTVLKELNARSVPLAFTKLPGLFYYGMSWCELRVPTDTNKTRWPVDLTWGILRELWGVSRPEPRVRAASRAENESRVVSRLIGALACLGACLYQDDLLEVMKYGLVASEQQLAERALDFATLIEDKRVRQIVEQGVPF